MRPRAEYCLAIDAAVWAHHAPYAALRCRAHAQRGEVASGPSGAGAVGDPEASGTARCAENRFPAGDHGGNQDEFLRVARRGTPARSRSAGKARRSAGDSPPSTSDRGQSPSRPVGNEPDTLRRAHAVHPISDLQIEYSLASRGFEHAILPKARALGIGVTACGVRARGAAGLRHPSRAAPERYDRRPLSQGIFHPSATGRAADMFCAVAGNRAGPVV